MEHDEFEHGMEMRPIHLLAGAIAGIAEHCGMYPIDTIKVCFQNSTSFEFTKSRPISNQKQ